MPRTTKEPRHFEERESAQLITLTFMTNVQNRMNVTARRTPGTKWSVSAAARLVGWLPWKHRRAPA